MSTLEHLARYESPHSGLRFRESLYGRGDDRQIVIDCLALANAELKGRRFLFFGIDDSDAEQRKLVGVDKKELIRFKRRLEALLERYVEPAINAAVRGVVIDGSLIGYIRIKDCFAPPYLTKEALGEDLAAGVGFIRRGARNYPLQRSDMQRMFARNREAVVSKSSIRVGFPGSELLEQLNLPALPLNKLPSELAAERLKSLMLANDQARDLFGRTETQFARLMHAKLYGADVPYQEKGDETLVSALKSVDMDYSAADAYYVNEVRAHKLDLVVANEGETHLHDTVLRITVPRIQGTGVAEKLYTEDESDLLPEGYPEVTIGRRTVSVESFIGTLYAGRSCRAFREPLRFLARPEAAGKAVTFDYELSAQELADSIKGSLVIYIDNASLKSV